MGDLDVVVLLGEEDDLLEDFDSSLIFVAVVVHQERLRDSAFLVGQNLLWSEAHSE